MPLSVSRSKLHRLAGVGVSAVFHCTLLLALSLVTGGQTAGPFRRTLVLDPTPPPSWSSADATTFDPPDANSLIAHRTDDPAPDASFSAMLLDRSAVTEWQSWLASIDRRFQDQPGDWLTDTSRGTQGLGRHLAEDAFSAASPRRPSRAATNYAQALGGLSDALAAMLAQSDLLIVWCFDESLSMKDDQQEVANQIGELYRELLEKERLYGHRFSSVVASFGDKFHRHLLRPTRDLRLVEKAMREVPIDPTGKERLCEALLACLHCYAAGSGSARQMAVVVVTDETGEWEDTEKYLEETIAVARRQQARIFFLGREAAFGARSAQMIWNGTVMAIDRGPETAQLRRLTRDAFGRTLLLFPSGYGPFNQCRLAQETGGVFVMLQGVERQLLGWADRSYDAAPVAALPPPYEPLEVQRQHVQSSPLRRTVVELAEATDRWAHDTELEVLSLEFPAQPSALRAAVQRQDKHAQRVLRFWDEAWSRLEEVLGEYASLEDQRWRADYELMRAQVAAYRVRIGRYRQLMRQVGKQSTLSPAGYPAVLYIVPDKQEPDDGDPAGTTALQLLRKVAEDWAGTPWAAVAEHELNQGVALRWSW